MGNARQYNGYVGQYRGATLGNTERLCWEVYMGNARQYNGYVGQYRGATLGNTERLCWAVQRGDAEQYRIVTLDNTEKRCWAVQRAILVSTEGDVGQYITLTLGVLLIYDIVYF
jgi:hypothetical protein